MKPVRIMPYLDIKNDPVVKGIHFTNIQDAGDPVANALFYIKAVRPIVFIAYGGPNEF